MNAYNYLQQITAPLQSRWGGLSAREQRSVLLLGVLLGCVVFWRIAIAPAWNTLHSAQERRDEVMQQIQRMQTLQRQAQALQGRQVLSREQALRSLQSLSASAGAGVQLTLQGEHVSVQIKAVRAQALATWLSQARSQAQALPLEVHLTRVAPAASNTNNPAVGAPNAAAVQAAPLWDGSLLLKLPGAAP